MKKRIGVVVDILMYLILMVQMMYVFIGNNVHELLGIGFARISLMQETSWQS